MRGMTLVEMTVVILLLLSLVAIIFTAARGWKNGTDRARCIMNIRQMQISVRAFASASNFNPGTDLELHNPPVNLLSELVGAGQYVPALPTCPGNGFYFFGGDVIPEIGHLYMTCSLAGSQGHQPSDSSNW